jgi:pimeloyl-ACP methyl ester carboxylesterase
LRSVFEAGIAKIGDTCVIELSQWRILPMRGPKGGDLKSKVTFVLVPGAWHGAWSYRRVEEILRARGHRTFALTLTGLCDRSHLLSKDVTLSTHVADVVNAVKWEGIERCVLVGHSYGGMVISCVAEDIEHRIDALVYLDAFLPEDGHSMLDINPEHVRQPCRLTGAHDRVGKRVYVRTSVYDGPRFRSDYDRVRSRLPILRIAVRARRHDRPVASTERRVDPGRGSRDGWPILSQAVEKCRQTRPPPSRSGKISPITGKTALSWQTLARPSPQA